MDTSFKPTPHKEAVAIISGKPVVAADVFHQMLPELRARVFTVSGIESANVLQRVRDSIADVAIGGENGQTWDQAKKDIAEQLDPWLGDGADTRAEMVLRMNAFQAFSASIYRAAQADEDTTHLQYLHGECAVPTPSHLALNGIILPKDDPFWDTHTGPWGHIGCVCYVRPMNPDLVEEAKAEDEGENPEDRNVITGAAAKQLRQGILMRDGRRHDVSPDGPDNSGFKWHPDDLRIPLKELEKKYDPETWTAFQQWASQQMLSKTQSVWDWLKGGK